MEVSAHLEHGRTLSWRHAGSLTTILLERRAAWQNGLIVCLHGVLREGSTARMVAKPING